MAKVFIENYDSLITYWNTKKGLAFFFITFLAFYFGALLDFMKEHFFEDKLLQIGIIPTVILFFIYLLWAFKSHRINLFNKEIITTGIFLKCSDSASEKSIKEIIKDLIIDLQDDYVEIKFILFPINHITTKAQLNRFVETKNHIVDNAFFATIYNGNCVENFQTVAKIEIQNIFFYANFNNSNSNFKNNIQISHDLSLRNLNKDWQYVESKSFTDKSKIKYNLKDSLLFFNGLYSIYLKENDLALTIFKSLKLSEDKEVSNLGQRKKQRLDEILLELFTFNAFEKYIDKKDIESAYILLKECEKLFKENHRFSFNNFINLSRIYFEKNNLSMAKEYTDKAIKIRNSCSGIYCNLGFFGMVENNVDEVFKNYKELAHVYKHSNKLNYVDVVDFIELHKKNFPDSLLLFDFGIAAINFLYVDKELGKIQLYKIKAITKANLTYSKIYELTNFLIEKGEIKSPYFYRDRKRKVS